MYSLPYLLKHRLRVSDHHLDSTLNSEFLVNLDVQQFNPEELSVKLTGKHAITIEGKHEMKQDEHGQIYRHFVRTYEIPKNFDISKLEIDLSSDGVLTVIVPKFVESEIVPITLTGKPAEEESKNKHEEDRKLKENSS